MPESIVIDEGFLLSPQQRRLWLHQKDQVSAAFHGFLHLDLQGRLDRELFEQALNLLCDQHPILRTTFAQPEGMGTPLQMVHPTGSLALEHLDYSTLSPTHQEEEVRHRGQRMTEQPFALEEGPLLRAALIQLAPKCHRLLLSLSSFCVDGPSLQILTRLLLRNYRQLVEGNQADTDETIPYALLAQWQNELLVAEDGREGRAFWRRAVFSLKEHGVHPLQKPLSDSRAFRPETLTVPFEPSLVNRFRTDPGVDEVAEVSVHLACFQTLLWRLQPGPPVLVGLCCDARDEEELAEAMGPLVKVVPTVGHLGPGMTFNRVLMAAEDSRQQAEQWQEGFDWEDHSEPKLGELPCFDFHLEQVDFVTEVSDDALSVSVKQMVAHVDRFKIKLSLIREGVHRALLLHYDPLFFAESDVMRLAKWHVNLLEALPENASRSVANIEFLSPEERQFLLYKTNETRVAFGRVGAFPDLFRAQAAQTPDRIALVSGEDRWTFSHLQTKADCVARRLRNHGVGPEEVVAVVTERRPETLAALLGTLMAGAVFAPLDLEPIDRFTGLLKACNASLLLSRRGQASQMPETKLPILFLDGDEQTSQDLESKPFAVELDSENLAYIIHTSGSTGLPKGSMITHGNLSHLFCALRQALFDRTERPARTLSLNGPLTFDTSVKQWVQLAAGHSLVLIPQAVRMEPVSMAAYLQERQVEVFDCTPSHWELLIGNGFRVGRNSPSRVLLGGEAIDQDLWLRLVATSKVEFFNLYGPTECTVDATCVRIDSQRVEPVLGNPIANVQIYLLDAYFHPVPEGIGGHMFIGGSGLARGYVGNPKQTAEHFIPNPFSGQNGDRLYRTGDLARRVDGGGLAFLGRHGNQVKIRGHRIEPAEVEAALETHPDVRKAVVKASPDGSRGPCLVAYVVPEPPRAPLLQGMRRHVLPNGLAIAQLNPNETDFLYEEIFEVQAYLKGGIHLPNGATIFDVGANIGMFSLFAHLRAQDVRIFAFEPNPAAFNALSRNLRHYGVQATLFACGLSSEAASADFTHYPEFSILSGLHANLQDDRDVVRSYISHQHQLQKGTSLENVGDLGDAVGELLNQRLRSETIPVPLRTLSSVLAETEVERIDLLKINVEKSEHQVLAGIEDRDWPRIQQIAVEIHDMDGRLGSMENLLRDRGFHLSVEKDWSLEQSSETNYYLYGRRAAEASSHERVVPQAPLAAGKPPLLSNRELREYLRGKLPEYMHPALFQIIESLPLNAHGKVDEGQLPTAEKIRAQSNRAARPPRTDLERQIAAIWQEVLQLETVDIHRSFFEVGGDSLLLVQVKSKLLKATHRDIPVAELFNHPSVGALAKYLETQPGTAESGKSQASDRAQQRRRAAKRRQRKKQSDVAAT